MLRSHGWIRGNKKKLQGGYMSRHDCRFAPNLLRNSVTFIAFLVFAFWGSPSALADEKPDYCNNAVQQNVAVLQQAFTNIPTPPPSTVDQAVPVVKDLIDAIKNPPADQEGAKHPCESARASLKAEAQALNVEISQQQGTTPASSKTQTSQQ